jgi:hypothetical protein
MDQFDTPIYKVRGAQPQPVPNSGAAKTPWRAPMILVAAMFAWLFIVFGLAAIVAPNDPNVELPLEVGKGVMVTPADGWYSAADVWDVGPDAVSLQRAGVYVAFLAEEYPGTNDELLAEMLEILEPDFDSFRVLPAAGITVAGDLPGLIAIFTGVSDKWGPENEVAVATTGGLGVVMLATGAQGQLSRMQGDLETMLQNLEIPR